MAVFAVTLRARWVPRADDLDAREAAHRHRIVCVVLAAHLPVLAAVVAMAGHPLYAVAATGAAAGLLAAALAPLSATARRLSAAAGLVGCSVALVGFGDGPQLAFHPFLTVAVLALYQDAVVYALAVVVVALQQLTGLGLTGPSAVGGDTWPMVHVAVLVAESALVLVLWREGRLARQAQAGVRAALAHGQSSVQEQLAETDRIRSDLIGTVSHEFRTPLTGIRGATLTLLKRGDRLDDALRDDLLRGMLGQQERLSRLLENMLAAALANEAGAASEDGAANEAGAADGAGTATGPDPAAHAEVDAVAAEVVMLAAAARPQCAPACVVVPSGTVAGIDRAALHQVLANLLDNAHLHGSPRGVPILAAGTDGLGVWVTVSSHGMTLPREATDQLFEPFTQLRGGVDRPHEGLGLGLYLVRRLVEMHGGQVALRSDSGWTTVELQLPAAERVITLPEADPARVGAEPAAPDLSPDRPRARGRGAG